MSAPQSPLRPLLTTIHAFGIMMANAMTTVRARPVPIARTAAIAVAEAAARTLAAFTTMASATMVAPTILPAFANLVRIAMIVEADPCRTPMILACGLMMGSAMSPRVYALRVPTAPIAAIAGLTRALLAAAAT